VVKTFRFPLGHIAGQTMTVGELIKKLSEYPEDTPVFAEWEGCRAYVEPEMFEVARVSKGRKEDECACLIIDVNLY
jgi:hypothetical protein